MALSLPNRRRLTLAALALPMGLLCAGLGACRGDRLATTGSLGTTDDVRVRHPYVLADGNSTLDIFPTGPGHLDPRQSADVDAFMLAYRRYGRGAIALDIPRGLPPGSSAAAERTAAAIRRIAAESGLRPGALAVSSYPIANPGLAAPLRLSFRRMEARVADKCGLWPEDLGVSNAAYDMSNRTAWNLGCATRANIAAQVADPVDLVRGREEGRIDTVRRTQVIDKLREGNDPSTTWRQDGKASVKDAARN